MKRIIVFLLAFILVILSGCISKPNDAMVVCGTYGVPGFVVRDMKGSAGPVYDCVELERDSKGRLLYEFSTINILSGEWETAVVICQKYDRKFVYFYEDTCYWMKNDENFSLEQLKLNNDWDQDLDYDKMSRREIVITIDSYVMVNSGLKINDVMRACQKNLDEGSILIEDIQIVDSDGTSHELFFFTTSDTGKRYFAIVNSELDVVLLDVSKFFGASAYVTFKQQNGWHYGIDYTES